MTDPQQHDGDATPWPTMADRGPAWPTMPGSMAPATRPASEPLAPARRKALAPQGMPHHDPSVAAVGGPPAAPPTPPTPTTPGGPAAAAHTPAAGGPAGERPQEAPAAGPAGSTLDGPVGKVPCPHCGAEVATYESFCEACGGELTPTSPAPADQAAGEESPLEGTRATPTAVPADPDLYQPASRTCPQCQGVVAPDGYCTQCGAKATSLRDHWTESPAAWVGGCSDRGVRHHRNEDAMGLAAEPAEGSRAVLVVCDGVSSSTDSDVAALAAARRARDVLVEARPAGLGTPASRAGAMGQALVRAAEEANRAVIANTAPDSPNAASCTFAAAVAEDGQVYYGNVGDSRVYWIDDEPEKSLMLSLDDSVAQARIAMGVSREEAENGYQAHAITKWLGRDAEDVVPRTGVVPLGSNGWVMVCSDGLWNYCTDATDLSRLVRALMESSPGARHATGLAERLCAWACEQGGKDNITVVLARAGALPDLPPAPPAGSATPLSAPTPATGPAANPASPAATAAGASAAGSTAWAGPTSPAGPPSGEPVPMPPGADPASLPTADEPPTGGSTAGGAPSNPDNVR